jgi:hypothetical protein
MLPQCRDIFEDQGLVCGHGKILVMDDEAMVREVLVWQFYYQAF